jgi:hypothetical protein
VRGFGLIVGGQRQNQRAFFAQFDINAARPQKLVGKTGQRAWLSRPSASNASSPGSASQHAASMPAAAWLEPMPALPRSISKTWARPASRQAMPSPTMPAPIIATRGRLAIEGLTIAEKDVTLALNAAPFAGMTQTEVPRINGVNELRCQSAVKAHIGAKGLFRRSVKRHAIRSKVNG